MVIMQYAHSTKLNTLRAGLRDIRTWISA